MWALIVLAVLFAIFVLFILGLCIPVDAVLEWDSTGQPRARIRLVWLLGLISFAPGRGARPKKEARREKKAKTRLGLTKILKIVTIKGLFGKVAALVKSSLRQIRIKDIEGDIKLELDDPADCGLVYALLGAAYPVFRSTRLNRISIEPIMGDELVIRGNARAVIRLQPIRLVIPWLKFMFSRPAISAMKIAIAG